MMTLNHRVRYEVACISRSFDTSKFSNKSNKEQTIDEIISTTYCYCFLVDAIPTVKN